MHIVSWRMQKIYKNNEKSKYSMMYKNIFTAANIYKI